MKSTKKIVLTTGILLFVVFLGGTAVLTAMRLAQNPEKPVAPTVPQVTPQAAAPTTTAACGLTFTVAANPSAVNCRGVSVSPNNLSVAVGGETRTLTASASGGVAPVTFSWAETSTGADKGTLSSLSGSTVTWTAPASPSASQTWTFAATARDAQNQTDSTDCVVTLTFSPVPVYQHKACQNNACVSVDCSPSNTPCTDTCANDTSCQPAQTYKHKVCQNNACVSVDCSPNTTPCDDSCSSDSSCQTQTTTTQTHKECQNKACVTVSGAGNDTCTSDASCQPAATPPSIPTTGFELPTFASIGAGALLILLGLAL